MIFKKKKIIMNVNVIVFYCILFIILYHHVDSYCYIIIYIINYFILIVHYHLSFLLLHELCIEFLFCFLFLFWSERERGC